MRLLSGLLLVNFVSEIQCCHLKQAQKRHEQLLIWMTIYFLGMCLKYLHWSQRSDLMWSSQLKEALACITEWVLLSVPLLKPTRTLKMLVLQVSHASGRGINGFLCLWSSGTEQYEWSAYPASLLLLTFSGSIWTWLLLFSCMSCPCLWSPSHTPW